jgi:hypothetical protein
MTRAERVVMIDRGRADLSVRRQCALLGLARSGIYRQPAAPDPGMSLLPMLPRGRAGYSACAAVIPAD